MGDLGKRKSTSERGRGRTRKGNEGWMWLKYIIYMYENVPNPLSCKLNDTNEHFFWGLELSLLCSPVRGSTTPATPHTHTSPFCFSYFSHFYALGAWTVILQFTLPSSLYLRWQEHTTMPSFLLLISILTDFLPRLALSHDAPDLCFPSS
jgi:hypothetical protein